MQNCRAIRIRLGRYCDGELPPVECRLIEDHLKQCGLCRKEVLEIQKISGVLQEGIPVPPVPSGLAQRIMAQARMQTDDTHSSWDFLRLWKSWSFPMRFAAVAVSAAACYIGLIIGSTSLPSTRAAGDEMQWVGMASPGPIAKAYMGSTR